MGKRAQQQRKSPRGEFDQQKPAAVGGGPRPWLAAILLAICVYAVYAPAFPAPFIFDDVDSIIRNESITTIWPLSGTPAHRGPLNPRPNVPTAARPLVNLTFAINYKFGQLNPTGYHAASAIIHFLCAILLWAIVRRTLSLPYFAGRFDIAAGWLAFAVAMIWALHPLQTETVIYATQRTELMMALFYLSTIYCSLRYWASDDVQFHRAVWLSFAFLACLAGMASKEVMVSAPLIVLLFDRAFISGSLAGALRKSWPLYAALAATWIPLGILSMGSPHGGAAGFNLGPPVYVWWFTQAKILWLYLKLAIWPNPLLIHYELPYVTTPLESCLYGLPLLLLGVGTLVLLWRNRPAGFLGTFVFAILSPTFVIPVITEMAAERRMYLPLAALVILFVVGGYQLAQSIWAGQQSSPATTPAFSPFAIAVPALIVALVCGVASAKRLEAYQQPLRLWKQVLRYQPQNDTAHTAIGKNMDDSGDSAAAVPYYREAARLKPDSGQAHYSLGNILLKTNAIEEAASEFAEGARLSPDDERVVNLAITLSLTGRNEEALVAIRAALRLAPEEWTFHNNEGEILKNLGRHQEAIESYQRALQINPDALDLYNEIADNYFKMKQPENASAALERGLELATRRGDRERVGKFKIRLRNKQ